tara:strand:+ start:5405 stop:5668 length:264 start_codon:yes stop_codon:yes gene_type:complete
MDQSNYIVFLSVKEDGVAKDHPIRPFNNEVDAEIYIQGYTDAILNHTGDGDKKEEEVKGLFSIRNVAGNVVNNNEDHSSTDKETENV